VVPLVRLLKREMSVIQELLWELFRDFALWLDSCCSCTSFLQSLVSFGKSREARLLAAADQGNLVQLRKLILLGVDPDYRDIFVSLSVSDF
jgi:predicted nucleic acid-binding Zn finger protein